MRKAQPLTTNDSRLYFTSTIGISGVWGFLMSLADRSTRRLSGVFTIFGCREMAAYLRVMTVWPFIFAGHAQWHPYPSSPLQIFDPSLGMPSWRTSRTLERRTTPPMSTWPIQQHNHYFVTTNGFVIPNFFFAARRGLRTQGLWTPVWPRPLLTILRWSGQLGL